MDKLQLNTISYSHDTGIYESMNPWISNLKGDCTKQYSVAWSATAELQELCCYSAMLV